jgi:hypothetical protein
MANQYACQIALLVSEGFHPAPDILVDDSGYELACSRRRGVRGASAYGPHVSMAEPLLIRLVPHPQSIRIRQARIALRTESLTILHLKQFSITMSSSTKSTAMSDDVESNFKALKALKNTEVTSFAWKNITVTVKDNETKEPKLLLDNVHGVVKPGMYSILQNLTLSYDLVLTCLFFR